MNDASGSSEGDIPSSLFAEQERSTDGTNQYIVVRPAMLENLIPKLAKRIQRAYFSRKDAAERLRQAVSELEHFSGESLEVPDEQFQAALEEELNAVIPQEWKADSTRRRQLDVQRSELAEIIAHEVLETLYQTIIPASRIAHKEIPDQPTRGADLVGIKTKESGPPPTLILVEVKGSCDAKTPPGVVKGMESKLIQLSTDRRTLLQELIWLRDNCDDVYARECSIMCAHFQLRLGPLDIQLTPILIRTESTHQATDAGVFRADPGSFTYAIQFISVILDVEDLFDFAVEVYRKARELDGDGPG